MIVAAGSRTATVELPSCGGGGETRAGSVAGLAAGRHPVRSAPDLFTAAVARIVA